MGAVDGDVVAADKECEVWKEEVAELMVVGESQDNVDAADVTGVEDEVDAEKYVVEGLDVAACGKALNYAATLKDTILQI